MKYFLCAKALLHRPNMWIQVLDSAKPYAEDAFFAVEELLLMSCALCNTMPGSSMSARSLLLSGNNDKRVHLQFRVPFLTNWGQSLVLCGSGALLGNFDPKKGIEMHCHHEKDVLVWECGVLIPWQPSVTYKYCVVRQAGEDGISVDKWEVESRTIPLHDGLSNGDIILVADVWKDNSHPSTILASSAFTNVIKTTRPAAKTPGPLMVERRQPGMGEAIVRLRVADMMAGPDEVICVSGSLPSLGNWQLDQTICLSEVEDHCWEGELRVPYSQFPFSYKYVIQPASLAAAASASLASSLGTAPSRHGHSIPLCRKHTTIPSDIKQSSQHGGHISRRRHCGNSSRRYYCGRSPPHCGRSPPHPSPQLAAGLASHATGTAALSSAGSMGAGMSAGDLPALLEIGEPRMASLTSEGSTKMGAPALVICHDGFFRREQLWRGAGVAVPVFSLRTLDSVGVGEFLDIIKLVDLADRYGMRMIQVLPINDTSVYGMWWDSYPYSTISVFALHPMYLALRALKTDLPVDLCAEIDSARGRLEGKQVDYEGVMATKLRIARQVFDRFGHEVVESLEFKVFDWFGREVVESSEFKVGQKGGGGAEGGGGGGGGGGEIDSARGRLEAKQVEYEGVMATKLHIARQVFDWFGREVVESSEFKDWVKENSYWLRPYAAFTVLRDLFLRLGFKKTATGFAPMQAFTVLRNIFLRLAEENSYWLRPYAAFTLLCKPLLPHAEHWNWGLLGQGTMETVDRLTAPTIDHYTRVMFTYWVQYHLHKQLKCQSMPSPIALVLKGDIPIVSEYAVSKRIVLKGDIPIGVSEYAVAKRIVLKGDIPIGVDKRSVDTWMDPQLFRMDKSTGAPPDCFDPNGQNWGFPTYNWENMAKDGYGWWQRRLQHMSQYFHAYRIDHILGFFRIWEIPGDCTSGILGHFRPSIPIWRSELSDRSINDLDRLCDPYIRSHLLDQIFGKSAAEVSARYMVEYAPGCFRLRPEYSSESQIAAIKLARLLKQRLRRPRRPDEAETECCTAERPGGQGALLPAVQLEQDVQLQRPHE
eukprot:gene28576-31736_t